MFKEQYSQLNVMGMHSWLPQTGQITEQSTTSLQPTTVLLDTSQLLVNHANDQVCYAGVQDVDVTLHALPDFRSMVQ